MTLSELDQLADLQLRFRDAIEVADPSAPVASCGRWTARELIVHLAQIHHWAAARAQRREPTPLRGDEEDLVGYYSRAAAELREVLAGLSAEAPAWTLLDDELPVDRQRGTVAFWHRRQKLETLIHLWDLRGSAGLDTDAAPALWQDCLAEVIEVMHPRQLRLGRVRPPVIRLEFAPTDIDGRFVLASSPAGPSATVAGPIRALALLAWGRLPPGQAELVVTGDRAGLVEILEAGLTP